MNLTLPHPHKSQTMLSLPWRAPGVNRCCVIKQHYMDTLGFLLQGPLAITGPMWQKVSQMLLCGSTLNGEMLTRRLKWVWEQWCVWRTVSDRACPSAPHGSVLTLFFWKNHCGYYSFGLLWLLSQFLQYQLRKGRASGCHDKDSIAAVTFLTSFTSKNLQKWIHRSECWRPVPSPGFNVRMTQSTESC